MIKRSSQNNDTTMSKVNEGASCSKNGSTHDNERQSTTNIRDTTFPKVPMTFMPCIDIKPQPDLATQYVDDGNILLKQHNISGAIYKYDHAIKKRPYYAIPHYNKRIALSMQNDIPSNTIAHKEIDTNLLIKHFQDTNLASQIDPYFVINIIAAVPERRFNDDSSDEEPDEEFNALYEELINNNDWPFTTRHRKTNKLKTESKILDLEPPFIYKNKDTADSIVVDPLLSKVLANGFESYDRDKLPTIAVSIGLNRMYSLSTRKNNSLILELESQVNTRKIKYKTFGYYWNCSWYTKIGNKAKIEDVKKFYKRLKNKNSDLAKKFIAQEENEGAECNVPYQYIRDHAKNHSKTIELIKSFRDNNNTAMLYLHLVDSDVIDFNKVYSAYLRIIAGCYKPPTVMSTGYVYPEGKCSKAYCLASYMERMYRVITTFHIPLGTYYPEPNMCVLIPQNCQTLEESFISPKRGKNLESPILIEHILNNRRSNVHAIFSEDNPIITKLPLRAKLSKKSKRPIKFSSEFNTGPAAPTSDDIKKFDQVSQSHSDSLTWSQSLFINKSINCDNDYETDGECIYSKTNKRLTVNKECNHFIANILKNRDVESSQSKLANRIGEDNSNNIVNAIKDIEQFKKYFDTEYERTPEEQEFINIMEKCEIFYENLSRKSLLMIIQIKHLINDYATTVQYLVDLDEDMLEYIINSDQIIQIMQLINNNTITDSLADLDTDMLEYIINSEEIIQALDHKEVDIDDLINIFRDNLEDFSTACDNGYGVQQILNLYQQDPLHLDFMANDPCDFVYMNSDDDIIVHFAIDNQYIDEDDIRNISEQLLDGRDDSAANMNFQSILLERETEEELAYDAYYERYNS